MIELRFVLRHQQPEDLGPEFQEEVRILQYRNRDISVEGDEYETEWLDVPLVDLRNETAE